MQCLPLQVLTAEQVNDRFPGYSLQPGYKVKSQPDIGTVIAAHAFQSVCDDSGVSDHHVAMLMPCAGCVLTNGWHRGACHAALLEARWTEIEPWPVAYLAKPKNPKLQCNAGDTRSCRHQKRRSGRM
jgi:hypothetical protein